MDEKREGSTAKKTNSHRRGSGVGHVYEILRNEIIELKFQPGSPVDESQLALRFSLSRTPIREALVRLAAEGLITALPNRTTIVSNIDFLNLPDFFDAVTLMYRVTMRLAAANRRRNDIERIKTLQRAFVQAVEAKDALTMISTNRNFHIEIAEAGRNHYYTRLFTQLLDEGRRIFRLYYSSFDDTLPRQYLAEHDEMIAAIITSDIELADKLGREHAEQVIDQIRRCIIAEKQTNARISL